MKTRTSQLLYRYWNDVRGARLAPTRLEIEPSRITEILSETFILEIADVGGYVFRLAGTRICDQLGVELRGRDFLDLAGPEHAGVLGEALATVAGQGAVAVVELEAADAEGRPVRFEALVLPLLHARQTVSRFLGAISAIDPPAWLGSVPLGRCRLVDHELHWPDGRPHALLERTGHQAPFLPAMVGARLVRYDRRQFRVLDGGLGQPAPRRTQDE